jgi:acyl-CoA thioester hydrolase
MDPFRQEVKVYLEDTDAQGIVYHANYLKYLERSRNDLLEGIGIFQRAREDSPLLFVVHEIHLKFLRPARMGDRLEVVTTAARASEFRMRFLQEIRRAAESPPYAEPHAEPHAEPQGQQGLLQGRQSPLLVSAEVFVVCVGKDGALVEIPPEVRL